MCFVNPGSVLRNLGLFQELGAFQLQEPFTKNLMLLEELCAFQIRELSPRNYGLLEELCPVILQKLFPGTRRFLRNSCECRSFSEELCTSWGTICFLTAGTFCRNLKVLVIIYFSFTSLQELFQELLQLTVLVQMLFCFEEKTRKETRSHTWA